MIICLLYNGEFWSDKVQTALKRRVIPSGKLSPSLSGIQQFESNLELYK